MATRTPAPHDLVRRLAKLLATLCLGLATLLPARLSAQDTEGISTSLRQGFHFSLGVGAASLSATCDGCDVDVIDDRLSGFSGVLQLGGAVNDQLVISGEFMGWIRNEDPIFRRMAALHLVFLGYPSKDSGFFLKGGAGVSRTIVEDDFFRATANAFSAVTGIGYDIPAGTSLIVTPYANFVRSFGGETDINGIVSPVAVQPNALQFGVALTVH